jgi:hypothetical protein
VIVPTCHFDADWEKARKAVKEIQKIVANLSIIAPLVCLTESHFP